MYESVVGPTSQVRHRGGRARCGLATAASFQTASADTAPAAGTPATVSGDGLPTWQINGVVWAQVLVGNTVYATGEFTKARPPGVPPAVPANATPSTSSPSTSGPASR